jgi:hypothetical protein
MIHPPENGPKWTGPILVDGEDAVTGDLLGETAGFDAVFPDVRARTSRPSRRPRWRATSR